MFFVICVWISAMCYFALSSWGKSDQQVANFSIAVILSFVAVSIMFFIARARGEGHLTNDRGKIEVGKIYITLCHYGFTNSRVALIKSNGDPKILAIELQRKDELPGKFMKTTAGEIVSIKFD